MTCIHWWFLLSVYNRLCICEGKIYCFFLLTKEVFSFKGDCFYVDKKCYCITGWNLSLECQQFLMYFDGYFLLSVYFVNV